MEVVTFEAAPSYTAPGHEDVAARRLQGGAASTADFALVGHSLLPSGAVIPMDAGSFGKIYVVTDGAITIKEQDGTRHVLQRFDSILIHAGEAREVINETDADASMIVVTPPPS